MYFNDKDKEYAKEVFNRYRDNNIPYYLSVGNESPYTDKDITKQLLNKLDELWNVVINEPEFNDVQALPQLHSIVWGISAVFNQVESLKLLVMNNTKIKSVEARHQKKSEQDLVNIMIGLRKLICVCGDDPTRDGLEETPFRVLKAYLEYTEGYREDPRKHLEKNLM